MASKYQFWTPSGLMASKATTSAPSRRGVDVSSGVFVSGMFTKDDPVTWEIHVLVRSKERWPRAREDRSLRFEGVEVGGPHRSDDVGEGRQPTRSNEGGPCQ